MNGYDRVFLCFFKNLKFEKADSLSSLTSNQPLENRNRPHPLTSHFPVFFFLCPCLPSLSHHFLLFQDSIFLLPPHNTSHTSMLDTIKKNSSGTNHASKLGLLIPSQFLKPRSSYPAPPSDENNEDDNVCWRSFPSTSSSDLKFQVVAHRFWISGHNRSVNGNRSDGMGLSPFYFFLFLFCYHLLFCFFSCLFSIIDPFFVTVFVFFFLFVFYY